jgi:hypothetical protein
MRGEGSDIVAACRVWSAVPRAVGANFEAWVGLFAVGMILYFIAWSEGDAWGATGLHLGVVLVLQLAGLASDAVAGVDSPFFVDGMLPGYGFAAWLLAGWALLALGKRLRASA